MRIAFVIESLEMGGSEKSLVTLLQNLNFEENTLELLLLKDGGFFQNQIPKSIIIKKIKSRKFSINKRIVFKFSKFFNHKKLHSAQLFWKIFSSNFPDVEGEYDVAVSYSQGFCTFFTAEKVNAKRKLTWNNVDFIAAGYNPNFDYDFYTVYDRIVLVSKFVQNQFSKVGLYAKLLSKTDVIYDITDSEKVISSAKSTKDLYRFTGFKILTVGRMEKEKGFDLAVETAKLLKDKGYNFKWLFLGDGSQRKRIESLIRKLDLEEFILITGKKENPYQYMMQCDLYVQPSKYEGWGLTIIEAKLLGKPVVSTNFPTAYEILKEGENGLIAEMNAKSLAEKIEMLLNNEELRNKLAVDILDEVDNRKRLTMESVKHLIFG